MNKNILIIIMCSMVIFASGCTLPGGGSVSAPWKSDDTGNNGLVVKDFYASPVEVHSGSETALKLTVKNVGGNNATNVKAKLYSPQTGTMSFEWKTSCFTERQCKKNIIDMCDEQRDRCKEICDDDRDCENECKSVYKDCKARAKDCKRIVSECKSNVKHVSNKMRYAKPDLNIEGEQASVSWRIQAPILEKYVKEDYTAKARVYYNYDTKAHFEIVAIPEEDVAAIEEKGGSVDYYSPVVTSSDSPIRISVDASQPVKISDVGDTFLITFKIENVGSFSPCNYSVSDVKCVKNKMNFIDQFKVTLPGNMEFVNGSCSNLIGGTSIHLLKGEYQIPCEVRINSEVTGETKYKISAFARYGYFENIETRLSARG